MSIANYTIWITYGVRRKLPNPSPRERKADMMMSQPEFFLPNVKHDAD